MMMMIDHPPLLQIKDDDLLSSMTEEKNIPISLLLQKINL